MPLKKLTLLPSSYATVAWPISSMAFLMLPGIFLHAISPENPCELCCINHNLARESLLPVSGCFNRLNITPENRSRNLYL